MVVIFLIRLGLIFGEIITCRRAAKNHAKIQANANKNKSAKAVNFAVSLKSKESKKKDRHETNILDVL